MCGAQSEVQQAQGAKSAEGGDKAGAGRRGGEGRQHRQPGTNNWVAGAQGQGGEVDTVKVVDIKHVGRPVRHRMAADGAVVSIHKASANKGVIVGDGAAADGAVVSIHKASADKRVIADDAAAADGAVVSIHKASAEKGAAGGDGAAAGAAVARLRQGSAEKGPADSVDTAPDSSDRSGAAERHVVDLAGDAGKEAHQIVGVLRRGGAAGPVVAQLDPTTGLPMGSAPAEGVSQGFRGPPAKKRVEVVGVHHPHETDAEKRKRRVEELMHHA